MIAPKINSVPMEEVFRNDEDNVASWKALYGSGKLRIRVFHNSNGHCWYQITYDDIIIHYKDEQYQNSPQESVDAAVKFLNELSGVLKSVQTNSSYAAGYKDGERDRAEGIAYFASTIDLNYHPDYIKGYRAANPKKS